MRNRYRGMGAESMERSFFDTDSQDPLTVDYYLSKLSFATIGTILRGSEYDQRTTTDDN